MNKYIATHTFKSEALRTQYYEVAASMAPEDIKAMVTGDKAVCLKNWTNGEKSMKAYCQWEAESPEAIIEQLGDMNNFFHTESEEMNDEIDFTSM
tara:strand:- start:157 stop:441 length:285 start_codon:yes stop_codon:yes gene_type:complete